MGNWVNWLLIIIGIVSVIIELALGALTGFDVLGLDGVVQSLPKPAPEAPAKPAPPAGRSM